MREHTSREHIPFLCEDGKLFCCLGSHAFFRMARPFREKSEQKKSHRVFFHLGLSLMNSVILYLTLAGPTYAAVLYTQQHQWGLAHLLGLSGGVEILASAIALDLWDYWMHLANHKIGFLWRFHKAHHSDMEVDVTTASRFHIGEASHLRWLEMPDDPGLGTISLGIGRL